MRSLNLPAGVGLLIVAAYLTYALGYVELLLSGTSMQEKYEEVEGRWQQLTLAKVEAIMGARGKRISTPYPYEGKLEYAFYAGEINFVPHWYRWEDGLFYVDIRFVKGGPNGFIYSPNECYLSRKSQFAIWWPPCVLAAVVGAGVMLVIRGIRVRSTIIEIASENRDVEEVPS